MEKMVRALFACSRAPKEGYQCRASCESGFCLERFFQNFRSGHSTLACEPVASAAMIIRFKKCTRAVTARGSFCLERHKRARGLRGAVFPSVVDTLISDRQSRCLLRRRVSSFVALVALCHRWRLAWQIFASRAGHFWQSIGRKGRIREEIPRRNPWQTLISHNNLKWR